MYKRQPQSPVVLAILDGWGYRKEKSDNAIKNARTPIMDSLWHAYPHTLISASGSDVGLPDGQMGNSEVGHLTIGSGRIIQQELVRISNIVKNNSFSSTSASSIPLVGIPTNRRLSSFFTFSIISEVKREIVFLSSTSLSITILFVFLDMIYQ